MLVNLATGPEKVHFQKLLASGESRIELDSVLALGASITYRKPEAIELAVAQLMSKAMAKCETLVIGIGRDH